MYRSPASLLPLTLPLSWLYRGGVALRRALAGRPARLDRPVISVGNLTVGGAGKTPFVEACGNLLIGEGLRPAVLSRGYGRAGRGPVMVSEGEGVAPLVDWRRSGDEPLLLARMLPGAVVAVGERRDQVGRIVQERDDLGVDLFLLDDGFQHQRLHRDLDIVLVRADDPFGNGQMLPAGPLREPPGALERAGAVVLTSCPDPTTDEVRRLEERIRAESRRDVPILHADVDVTGLVDAAGAPGGDPHELGGERVAAFCGLADPRGFRRSLESLGAEVVLFKAFPDHHPYTGEEFLALYEAARETGAGWLLTTEKDAVRLAGINIPFTPLSFRALAVRARPHEPEALRDLLLETAKPR